MTKLTDALSKRIDRVLEDRKARRYSSSLIYRTHNELFGKKEAVQTCPSCLVIRANAIAKWAEENATNAAQYEPQELVPNELQPTETPEHPDSFTVTTGGKPDSKPAAQTEEQARVNTLADSMENVQPVVTPEEPAEGSAEPVQVLLQKINKDDYKKTEGDPFFATFVQGTEEEGKGTATVTESGKNVAPGTYATDRAGYILTSFGGKVTFKSVQ